MRGNQNKTPTESSSDSGMPDRIRTYDLLLRKQTLYPAELRAHIRNMMRAGSPLGATDPNVDVLNKFATST